MLLTPVICHRAAAAPVFYKDGKLHRSSIMNEDTSDPADIEWRIGSTPCNYPPGHEDVLGPIVELVRQKAPPYQFQRGPGTGNGPNHATISCGNSADAMKTAIRESGLLPENWKVLRADSVDTFAGTGAAGHTVYVLESPDGKTSYLLDSYFYKAEITKMTKFTEDDSIYYKPAEENHNFSGSGYVQLFGNMANNWKAVDEDVNFYHRDRSKTLELPAMHRTLQFLQSYDPNGIQGPGGATDAKYINGANALRYTVHFENLASASLPAAEVSVDALLDPTVLDLGSVQFGTVRFGSHEVQAAPTANDFTADVDLRPELNLIVRLHGWFDSSNGMVRWTFTSLDPATMALPEAFDAGFLPPNTTPPAGEGAVSFSIWPREDLVTGQQIAVSAAIQFDANTPMNTPVWTNTIDKTLPDSTASPLPATVDTPSFDVPFSASDAHAGISTITLYASVDGGAYTIFTSEMAPGSFAFEGAFGHTYAFYTVAEDAAGNRQPVPATAQATVSVNAAPAEGESEGEGGNEGEGEGEGEGGNGSGCQGCNKSTTPTNDKGDHTTLAFAGVLLAAGSLTKKRWP
jgi:hypothetical protein